MSEKENNNIPAARRRIARIRCLQECVSCLLDRKPFPESLCYVPSVVDFTTVNKVTWKFYEEPCTSSKVVKEVSASQMTILQASGEDVRTKEGQWLKALKVLELSASADPTEKHVFEPGSAYLLLHPSPPSKEDQPVAVRLGDMLKLIEKNAGLALRNKLLNRFTSWEGVVEQSYAPLLKKQVCEFVPPDKEAVERLRSVVSRWTSEHDKALVQLMAQYMPAESDNLGTLRGFVDSMGVSSYSEVDGESYFLTDDNEDTYWETDGTQGMHWLRLNMRKGTIVKHLSLTVNLSDDNYLPKEITIVSGEGEEARNLNYVHIDWSTWTKTEDKTDIELLSDLTEHHPIIVIRIESCKSNGIDTRIRKINLDCTEDQDLGFEQEFFSDKHLVRFPLLQSFDGVTLFRRSEVLQRLICLLDSVLPYLVPAWQSSLEMNFSSDQSSMINLQAIRHILPLSKKRLNLIDGLLKLTVSDPPDRSTVYMNRLLALAHRAYPAGSADYSNTVFMQLHEGLTPRNRSTAPPTYRWSTANDQWWECKFISEGIVDQGGGFRDSLSDIAEELCPSDPDAPMALPYFIRTPNQSNDDGNVNRDCYIPNPNCHDFDKYEWIGQLMGACFRGREILILSLAPYIWKRLVGESFTWTTDFATVDAAEVGLIEGLLAMDPETFSLTGRAWSMQLSDGNPVTIRCDSEGNPKRLDYADRADYADKVREIRLQECDKQLKALRSGLLKVVPLSVLEMITWQELETRICGQAEITVASLIKNTYYHHIEEYDQRVKYFWAAVKNFTNEERSRLLRFITGRRRLPVSVFISSGKDDSDDPLPESSTCCNTLHLPKYSSEKIAEERLRYAVYNCVSIDTDEY